MLSEYRTILVSLFESLHRLKTDPHGLAREAWAIQNTLIEQITAAEERIRNVKQLTTVLRKELATPQPVRLTKAQSQKIKEKIAAHNDDIEVDERLIDILRDVGDGLAFTYIDKWDIKPLAFKQSSGYLSGKVGITFELTIANRAFNEGGVAILNDLTHCLRYGDVTVIQDGAIAIIEAKTGKTLNQRAKRQCAANDMICEYLQTDHVVGLFGTDHEIRRVELGHPEVNHIPILLEMIDEAFHCGGSYRQVETGLHYMVDVNEDINGLKGICDSIGGKPYVCIVNMMKWSNIAYYPFTLAIANPARLYDFYNGEYVITIGVELNYVAGFFKSRGFTANFHSNEPYFLTLGKDEPSSEQIPILKISGHFWDRLFAEFVSLEWLLTEIDRKYANMNATVNSKFDFSSVQPRNPT